MNERNYVIEIATADFTTTQAAVEGGADRIELCAGLSEGGTTPSKGTIRACREKFEVAIFPIIRPRGGDFLFTEEEFEIMKSDIRLCRELGCDGVVVGFLDKDGTVDPGKLEMLVNLAYPLEVSFHRAFDRCADPFSTLEVLIEAGCQRLLTSGQKPAAPDGAALIRQLVEAADERLIIMPGSGVRADNIRALAEATGAVEFHSSLRSTRSSQMEFRHPSFRDSPESYSNPAIDPQQVRQLRKALGEVSSK